MTINANLDNLTVIIPMAGRGQRFKDVGILTPKPLLKVAGIPTILRATDSLSFFNSIPSKNIVAVVRSDDMENYQIDAELKQLFPGISVLVDKDPQGATSTALVARDFVLPDSPLLIMDCDIWFKSQDYENILLHSNQEISGAIPVFEVTGDRWSFSAVDSEGSIRQVIEKKRIEVPHCTLLANVGFYYFTRGSAFLHHAIVTRERKIYGSECYLSEVIHQMLGAGLKFRAALCEAVQDMGTPESRRLADLYFRK